MIFSIKRIKFDLISSWKCPFVNAEAMKFFHEWRDRRGRVSLINSINVKEGREKFFEDFEIVGIVRKF